MNRCFSLFKKQFLYFLAIFLVTASMTVVIYGKCIDLKLNEKPVGMSAYKWCKEIAEENVEAKTVVLLVFLKVKTKKDWEKCKSSISRPCDPCDCSIVTMPKYMQDCVYNVFNYHAVVDAVKPISIYEECDDDSGVQKIVIETENFGTIKVVAISEDCVAQTIEVQGGHVIIELSVSGIKDLKLSSDSVEGLIGHELAHIIHEHTFEEHVISCIYGKNSLKMDDSEREKYNDYSNVLSRACEVEADIVGTFGNPRWAKGLIEYVKKLEAEDFYDDSCFYPTKKQRIAYLQEIYKSLKNC